jgi:hypothetical protein
LQGTGHQCNDQYRYWYWGYGANNGTWYPLGDHTGITNGVAHTFKISEAFNGTNEVVLWQIDGSTKASINSSATYGQDRAGLESWVAPPTYINVFNISSLKAQRNGGSFANWSGKDSTLVTNSAMCGKWISAITWNAGESNPCP